MNLKKYQRAKLERRQNEKIPRSRCARCRRPETTCYCSHIIPFKSNPQFVILMHREEVKRSVATGRMAHLILSNSLLIEGTDFTHNEQVNALINDPLIFPVVLYPGPKAINLTEMGSISRNRLFPEGRQVVVFIIDGTWSQAKRTKRLSTNLNALPQLCFTPPRPSAFLVRKQPRDHCYSTIESAHQIIDLIGKDQLMERGNLLDVFAHMVAKQMDYLKKYGAIRGFRSTRGNRESATSASRTLHTAHNETTDQA